MMPIWQLYGTPMLPAEPAQASLAEGVLGGWSSLVNDPGRYMYLLLGYDETASIWPDSFRRRFCDTVPTLELAPGVAPPDDVAELLGAMLVSRTARRVLDAAGCDAGYGDVTGTAVDAGAWFTLWPRAFADLVDHARTPGGEVSVLLPDGTLGALWQRSLPEPGEWPVLTSYREDFVAPAPLFRGAGTKTTYVSDALADQMLRAGLAGITLQDTTSDRGQRERVLKTL